ncbi:MAG: glycoside hydrolase family 3 C-terminal domain-containing protein [Anaerolineae bacterium]|nr:glycoside hydrolase family 3 C-terminal domain-containing protein [Anaerolineae bacterium]
MTLEEKAALCTGEGPWATTPISRLSVPPLVMSDGPHGVRHPIDIDKIGSLSHSATCFPTASSLACTWDVALMHEMGQALAEEANALDVGVLLGPGNNMKRTPLCGRNFEYFSEDPYLGGEIAASLIEGMQSRGVGASLKHFAFNNQEYQRFSISAEVDERSMREIYLAGFEKAIKKGKPWTVMCAYNKLHGTYCSEHYWLLVDILKEEWGFEGLVVSDWGAVHDRVAALKGGLDLEMPGPKESRVQAVIRAVRDGTLSGTVLDEAVRRILKVVCKAAETPKGEAFDQQTHHILARKIAVEGMVLLKNNGILPLKRELKHIAVIGRAAKSPHYQGGGSSHINPTMVAIPFEELQRQAGDTQLTYAEGYPSDDQFRQELIDQAVSVASGAEVALLYIALPTYKESEGYDRTDLDLTEQQIALIKAVGDAQPNTVVILNNGSAIVVGEWIQHVNAVLEAWMMGQAGGGAIADVLFGKVNPSGKLAETFPVKLSDTPAYLHYPGENGKVTYGEGLFIGYRYYDTKQLPVQFPFGYGGSYTTFAYSNATVSANTFKDADGLTVTVDVTNTGSVAGKEVVQVYVHDHKSALIRPYKELKGFAKVDLQPGETKTVTLVLDFRAFAYYHPGYRQWITEDGEFDILIGASSADIRCKQTVVLQSTQQLPSLLNQESTIREWLDDPRGKAIFAPMFERMVAGMSQSMGGETDADEMIGIDIMTMVMDMPLLNVLNFQEAALPATPEQIVSSLLQQVHQLPE